MSSPSSHFQILPLVIVEGIVDYLHYTDRTTLPSLLQSCSTWRSVVSKQYFSLFTLDFANEPSVACYYSGYRNFNVPISSTYNHMVKTLVVQSSCWSHILDGTILTCTRHMKPFLCFASADSLEISMSYSKTAFASSSEETIATQNTVEFLQTIRDMAPNITKVQVFINFKDSFSISQQFHSEVSAKAMSIMNVLTDITFINHSSIRGRLNVLPTDYSELTRLYFDSCGNEHSVVDIIRRSSRTLKTLEVCGVPFDFPSLILVDDASQPIIYSALGVLRLANVTKFRMISSTQDAINLPGGQTTYFPMLYIFSVTGIYPFSTNVLGEVSNLRYLEFSISSISSDSHHISHTKTLLECRFPSLTKVCVKALNEFNFGPPNVRQSNTVAEFITSIMKTSSSVVDIEFDGVFKTSHIIVSVLLTLKFESLRYLKIPKTKISLYDIYTILRSNPFLYSLEYSLCRDESSVYKAPSYRMLDLEEFVSLNDHLTILAIHTDGPRPYDYLVRPLVSLTIGCSSLARIDIKGASLPDDINELVALLGDNIDELIAPLSSIPYSHYRGKCRRVLDIICY